MNEKEQGNKDVLNDVFVVVFARFKRHFFWGGLAGWLAGWLPPLLCLSHAIQDGCVAVGNCGQSLVFFLYTKL